MSYPKPPGWNGGPDGSIMRQGSAGHLSANFNTDKGEDAAREERFNELEFDHADFGGSYAGQCYPLENYCAEDE